MSDPTAADEFDELIDDNPVDDDLDLPVPEPDPAAATSAALRRVVTSGNYRPDTKKRAPAPKRSRGRDPQLVGGALDDLLTERGWTDQAAIAHLVGEWDQVVGPELAEHVQLESFEQGRMVLRADSTAWATQLRLLLPQVREALEARVGSGVIADISIAGPQAPSWKHGSRSVKGRGPRDTYG